MHGVVLRFILSENTPKYFKNKFTKNISKKMFMLKK
jgi:hypothetical protein